MGTGCGRACLYTHMQNANIGRGLEMFGLAFNKKGASMTLKFGLAGGGVAKFLSSL